MEVDSVQDMADTFHSVAIWMKSGYPPDYSVNLITLFEQQLGQV